MPEKAETEYPDRTFVRSIEKGNEFIDMVRFKEKEYRNRIRVSTNSRNQIKVENDSSGADGGRGALKAYMRQTLSNKYYTA